MFAMLLPKRSPAARLGAPIRTAVPAVTSSGSEVASAKRTIPNQRPPTLVREAITSALRASVTPANTTPTAPTAKPTIALVRLGSDPTGPAFNYLTRARGKKTKKPIRRRTGARLMEPCARRMNPRTADSRPTPPYTPVQTVKRRPSLPWPPSVGVRLASAFRFRCLCLRFMVPECYP